MKSAVIVHGFKGKPHTNWKPWLKSELQDNGFHVLVPEMPNTDNPIASEWIDTLDATLRILESDKLYLIGHSLGCITILKYLESPKRSRTVKSCIFVAGFGRKFREYEGGHDTFFDKDLDWNEIRKNCDHFTIIHSSDDTNVNIREANFLKDNLKAKIIIVDGLGHFGSADNVFEVPLVRDAVLCSK